MTESHSITTLDSKTTTSKTTISSRVSYTSRFKIASSRSSASRSKLGGVGDSDLALSTTPKTEGQDAALDKCSRSEVAPVNCRKTSMVGYSLFQMVNEKRARRIKLYRNGDRFFKGMVYAVSNERFRTFQTLLSALTCSPVCDRKSMPNGVRNIYSLDGSRRIDTVDGLIQGQSYVCASIEPFRCIDYTKHEDPGWNSHVFLHHEPNHIQFKNKEKVRVLKGARDSEIVSTASLQSQPRPASAHDVKLTSLESRSYKSEVCNSNRKTYEEYQRSFVTPRLITLIKYGRRPRKTARLLLNKKTAQSFQQVITDINEVIKFDCGRVKTVYTMSGQQVMCLADFFQSDTVFLICGNEKPAEDDFILSKVENSQIHALRPFKGKSREKIMFNKTFTSSAKCSTTSLIPHTDSAPETHHKLAKFLPAKREVNRLIKENMETFISKLAVPTVLANKYDVGTLVGKGSFAVVMECTDKKTNKKYALKIINKEKCKGKEDIIDNEVRILRCVKHPNIIRLVEDYSSQNQIFCIMELVKGGDLFDAIAYSTTKYTEQDASYMLYNLASALQYLHALYIVHRDVKPENILIRQLEDGTKMLKLGDFGLATEVKGPLYTVCGTPTYVAPEIIAETGYGLKIDMWSAGVTAYILLCGFPPFISSADDQEELFDMITTGTVKYPSPYWDDVSSTAKDVISHMLNINPEERLSAAQVLDHKWVSRDHQYEADLRGNISKGLGTYCRQVSKFSQNCAGIKILVTTALDKASKFFRGRGILSSTTAENKI